MPQQRLMETTSVAKPISWIAAGVIVVIWIVVVAGIGWVVISAV
jgi:hypothetical protein